MLGPFRSRSLSEGERERPAAIDQSRRCQPAGVRHSRPARSSDSSTAPSRSFFTPRDSRSFARVSGRARAQKLQHPLLEAPPRAVAVSGVEPSPGSPTTSRWVVAASVATSSRWTGGQAGAARCSLESTNWSRLRRRYRFESPKAWMSLEPRRP